LMRSLGVPEGRRKRPVKGRDARLALLMGGRVTGASAGEGRKNDSTTREWRRKPLKSLKTDSAMAIRRLAFAGKENRSGEFGIGH
jgi:hypothetical protein